MNYNKSRALLSVPSNCIEMIERIQTACITTAMGSILLTQLQPKNIFFHFKVNCILLTHSGMHTSSFPARRPQTDSVMIFLICAHLHKYLNALNASLTVLQEEIIPT